jgi:type II secretory pathway pseudopilin PulG
MHSSRRVRSFDLSRPRRGWSPPAALRAFTLIELVVSMSVGIVVCGLAGSLVWNASRLRAETGARSELVDLASAAVEIYVRYTREIAQNECPSNPTPCLQGNAQISLASASQLVFGTTGFRYDAANGRLEISNNGGTTWQLLCSDVSSCTFSYVNRLGSSLATFPLSATDRAAVRRVGIDLQLTRGAETAHLRASTFLRNFMNEVTGNVGS